MKKIIRFFCFSFLFAFLLGSLISCREAAPDYIYSYYTDIPGLSKESIAEIEKIASNYDEVILGCTYSTAAFPAADGSVNGAVALFCEWLSDFFGITFTPQIYEFNDLLDGLDNNSIHFCTDFSPFSKYGDTFYHTSSISERLLKQFFVNEVPDYENILAERKLQFAFLNTSSSYNHVKETFPYPFDIQYFNNAEEVATALLNGTVDAFFEIAHSSAHFLPYENITSIDYLPIQYKSAALGSASLEFAPIIDAVELLLENNGNILFSNIDAAGELEYKKYAFQSLLTKNELIFLENHIQYGIPVTFAAETNNYPTSFYNFKEKEFQGMALDVLDEISSITGLGFMVVSTPEQKFSEIVLLLEDGTASMISEIIKTPERQGRYLWTNTPYSTDYYALLSRSDNPDLSFSQMLFSKVGIISNTGYAQMFTEWFPEYNNYIVFQQPEEAFTALENGEIDLLMATNNLLLNASYHLEMPGFKVNIPFEQNYDTHFAFNKNEEILASIISKAQKFVNTDAISSRWKHRVFNYQNKLSRDIIPFLLAGVFVLSVVLIWGLVALYKNKVLRQQLEVTVEKRTEELREQTQTAQTASRIKGDFLARMSHEIRTPLNAIVGMSQIAKKEADNEKTNNAVDVVIRSSSHLLGIINNVLDMSKIESGKFRLINDVFDLHAAIWELSNTYAEKCSNTTLMYSANIDIPVDTYVLADKRRIVQMLNNLLENAVKFGNYLVTFNVAVKQNDKDFITLHFSVADDGIGVADKDLKRIFAPFEQADGNAAMQQSGTGLGLTISQSLAEQMGTSIELETTPGQGAVFSFQVQIEKSKPPFTVQNKSAEQVVNLKNKHVLYAEDIEINRILFKELLGNTDMHITEANNGDEAVELFSRSEPGHYNIIFMDIQMPKLNGYEATRQIRALERADAKTVPIIALTANSYAEDIENAISAGMNTHLAKPVDKDAVMEVIRQYLA